jgi:hypothetical protein
MKRFLFVALATALSLSGVAAQDGTTPDFARMMDLFMNKMADRAPYWRCEAETKFSCAARGCERTGPLLTYLVDFDSDEYQRCDNSGCDDYKMTWRVDMTYTIISLSDRPGSSMTVSNDGAEFAETFTIETTSYNSFGACSPAEK